MLHVNSTSFASDEVFQVNDHHHESEPNPNSLLFTGLSNNSNNNNSNHNIHSNHTEALSQFENSIHIDQEEHEIVEAFIRWLDANQEVNVQDVPNLLKDLQQSLRFQFISEEMIEFIVTECEQSDTNMSNICEILRAIYQMEHEKQQSMLHQEQQQHNHQQQQCREEYIEENQQELRDEINLGLEISQLEQPYSIHTSEHQQKQQEEDQKLDHLSEFKETHSSNVFMSSPIHRNSFKSASITHSMIQNSPIHKFIHSQNGSPVANNYHSTLDELNRTSPLVSSKFMKISPPKTRNFSMEPFNSPEQSFISNDLQSGYQRYHNFNDDHSHISLSKELQHEKNEYSQDEIQKEVHEFHHNSLMSNSNNRSNASYYISNKTEFVYNHQQDVSILEEQISSLEDDLLNANERIKNMSNSFKHLEECSEVDKHNLQTELDSARETIRLLKRELEQVTRKDQENQEHIESLECCIEDWKTKYFISQESLDIAQEKLKVASETNLMEIIKEKDQLIQMCSKTILSIQNELNQALTRNRALEKNVKDFILDIHFEKQGFNEYLKKLSDKVDIEDLKLENILSLQKNFASEIYQTANPIEETPYIGNKQLMQTSDSFTQTLGNSIKEDKAKALLEEIAIIEQETDVLRTNMHEFHGVVMDTRKMIDLRKSYDAEMCRWVNAIKTEVADAENSFERLLKELNEYISTKDNLENQMLNQQECIDQALKMVKELPPPTEMNEPQTLQPVQSNSLSYAQNMILIIAICFLVIACLMIYHKMDIFIDVLDSGINNVYSSSYSKSLYITPF